MSDSISQRKVCVVTGSSSGIGAATARLYAERGWGNDMTVGVGCKGGRHRSVVGAEFLAAGLREHGHTVTVFHRDLSREGNA
jgi:NAD(P)-dependent dehydrogenase (short-subunit alcohol dehydrogenase family)